jgi:phosphate ABC transporter phosphate-binding protein
MTYDAVGSVQGAEELSAGKIDMAASDIPAAAGQEESALRIPSVAGAIVPIYNLNLPLGRTAGASESLNLTGTLLAAIYGGKVTMWDDPAIASSNRGVRLPHAAISVVHRSDGSGTTFVWTSFLAQADAEWKVRVGATVEWPAGIAVAGNEGVAEEVARTPNSIGYVELAYAIQHRLRYAAVRNPSGKYIKASLETVSAAAGTAGGADGLVLNAAAKDAYPITTFTWLLVPRSPGSSQKLASIKAFLQWMLTSGQRECSSLGYAPLPKGMAAAELKVVNGLK